MNAEQFLGEWILAALWPVMLTPALTDLEYEYARQLWAYLRRGQCLHCGRDITPEASGARGD